MRVGIDVVEISRFKNKPQSFLEKNFNLMEIEYANQKPKPFETFAGIFACKEAFLKAIGLGVFKGIHLVDIQINYNNLGKPVMIISDLVAKKFNISDMDISISHDGDVATAICVIN